MWFSVFVKSQSHKCVNTQLSYWEKGYSNISFKNHHQRWLKTNRCVAEKTYNTVVGEQGSEEVQTFQTAPCRYHEMISGPKDASRHLVEQL